MTEHRAGAADVIQAFIQIYQKHYNKFKVYYCARTIVRSRDTIISHLRTYISHLETGNLTVGANKQTGIYSSVINATM